MKQIRFFVFVLLLAAVFPACGSAGGEDLPPEPQEGVLTYAALDPLTSAQEKRILKFNKDHPDVQIEVLDYSDEGGIDRLLTELALGRIPDIMNLRRLGKNGKDSPYWYVGNYPGYTRKPEGEYWMPYRQLVQKGYLEDLWPYIENDPKLGREALLEAPVKAAEVNGGLYMLFRDVYITTLAGSENVVGDRDRWTLEELFETFSTMPEGSTILRYNATRWEMYSNLFCTTLDQYIDWEKGRCSFDTDEFRSMLDFLAAFPAEFKTSLTSGEVKEELVWRRLGGEQMLETIVVRSLSDTAYIGTTFGGKRVAYIGYPTADGSSSSFFRIPEIVLAMSSACPDKEAAWEFMGYLVRDVYAVNTIDQMAYWDGEICIPVNRKNYENNNTADLRRHPKYYHNMLTFPGGPFLEADPPTEDDIPRFEALINNTKQIYWPDDALSETVWEAIGPYFAGDKTMEETIRLVENRVGLYVGEQN